MNKSLLMLCFSFLFTAVLSKRTQHRPSWTIFPFMHSDLWLDFQKKSASEADLQLKAIPRKISSGGDSRLELWVGIIYYLELAGWCIKGQRSGRCFRNWRTFSPQPPGPSHSGQRLNRISYQINSVVFNFAHRQPGVTKVEVRGQRACVCLCACA